MFLIGNRFVDHLAQAHHVLQTVNHPGFGRRPVASRTPSLLIVGFDAFRQVEMRDEPHVGLVDAHTESNRRHHDHAIIAQKPLLVGGAHARVEPRMVGQGRMTLRGKPHRSFLDLAARHAIHDARATRLSGEKMRKLLARIGTRAHGVADVRAIEAADKPVWIFKRQTHRDVGTGTLVSRRRQCHARHTGEVLAQLAQREVVLPKIVSPLRDTVRLVNRDQYRVRADQLGERFSLQNSLGRDIE